MTFPLDDNALDGVAGGINTSRPPLQNIADAVIPPSIEDASKPEANYIR